MTQADSVHSTPPKNTSPPLPENPPPDTDSLAGLAGQEGADPASQKERTGDAPAAPETGLYVKTDVSPEELFQAIGRLRKEAQDEIDRLLTFLDAIEDPEIEDDEIEDDPDHEPSLGSDAGRSYGQQHWSRDAGHDLEEEHDGREPHDGDAEPDHDGEPSLGASEAYSPSSQIGWEHSEGDREQSDGIIGMPVHPDQVDIEDEHDGAEPDVCGEPILGSFDRMVDQENGWRQRPVWVQDGEVDVFGPGMPSTQRKDRSDAR